MLIDSILSDFPHNERPDFFAACTFMFLIGNGLNRYLEFLTALLKKDLSLGETIFVEARIPFKCAQKLTTSTAFTKAIGQTKDGDDILTLISNSTESLLKKIEVSAGTTARVAFTYRLLKTLKAYYESGVGEGLNKSGSNYTPKSKKAKAAMADLQNCSLFFINNYIPFDHLLLFSKQKQDKLEEEPFWPFKRDNTPADEKIIQQPAKTIMQPRTSEPADRIESNVSLNPYQILGTPVYQKNIKGQSTEDIIIASSSLAQALIYFVMNFIVTKIGKDREAVRQALKRFIVNECKFFEGRPLQLTSEWETLFARYRNDLKYCDFDLKTATLGTDLEPLFHAFLISITAPERFYVDDINAEMIAVLCLSSLTSGLDEESFMDELLSKAQVVEKHTDYPKLGLSLGKRQSVLFNTFESADFWKILTQYPLVEFIEVTADLVLSRLCINNPLKQLEQFLAEQKEVLLPCDDLKHLKTYQRVMELFDELAIGNSQTTAAMPYFDDGPVSPEQMFGYVATNFQKISPTFAGHISLSVLTVILEKVKAFKIKGNDWSTLIDPDFNRKAGNFALLSESFKESLTGNRYRDSFEYGANQLSISSLKEKEQALSDMVDRLKIQSQSLQRKFRKSLDDIATLKSELAKENTSEDIASERLDEVTNLLNYALEENELASTTIEELENFNKKLSEEKNRLENRIRALGFEKANADFNGADFVKSELYSLISEDWEPTPENALKLVEAIAPDRIVLHEKVWSSVKKLNPAFKNGRRLFNLLKTLAFDYLDKYLEGGDQLARSVFSSNAFSANESEGTANSRDPKIRNCRRITYQGKTFDLEAHLKLGVSSQDSVRIYFMVDQVDRKIVIGYCGPHPKNLSTN